MDVDPPRAGDIDGGDPPARAERGPETAPKHPLAQPWLWVIVLVIAGTVPVFWRIAHPPRAALPVYWTIPSFRLLDQQGRAFGSTDLAGRVYVADFVFTLCQSTCPTLSTRMSALQPRLAQHGTAVRLVSFSVDPVNDTPARLATYARRFRADESRWSFLTGPREQMMELFEHGFRVVVQDAPREADGGFDPMLLAHSDRFVVIDRRARMRGIYDPGSSEAMDRLVADVAALLEER